MTFHWLAVTFGNVTQNRGGEFRYFKHGQVSFFSRFVVLNEFYLFSQKRVKAPASPRGPIMTPSVPIINFCNMEQRPHLANWVHGA